MIRSKKLLISFLKNPILVSKCTYLNPSESVLNGFTATVGNTPLVKLERLSKESGCNILVKCEYMNPGGKFQNFISKNL